MKKIQFNNITYAILIDSNYESNGIEFFTPNEYSQQLAYMKREKDYEIQPHIHNKVVREVFYTQETLIIKRGKVRVDIYNENHEYLSSTIIKSGDIILLVSGGHGFKMLEETEIIEIKQGPYVEENDKKRFNSVKNDKINFIK